jgi:hypothetical protein
MPDVPFIERALMSAKNTVLPVQIAYTFNPTFKLPDKRHILSRKTTPESSCETRGPRRLFSGRTSGSDSEVEPYRGFARFWEGLGLKGVAKIEKISHISEK